MVRYISSLILMCFFPVHYALASGLFFAHEIRDGGEQVFILTSNKQVTELIIPAASYSVTTFVLHSYSRESCSKLDTGEIAQHVSKIIDKFKLRSKLESKNYMEVQVDYCGVTHAPVIASIDNSSAWPQNIIKTLESKHSSLKLQRREYIDMLAFEIMKFESYRPFLSVLIDMGCSANLDQPYLDPIYYKKHYMPSKIFLQRGFDKVTNSGMTKEVYPMIKSAVSFAYQC